MYHWNRRLKACWCCAGRAHSCRRPNCYVGDSMLSEEREHQAPIFSNWWETGAGEDPGDNLKLGRSQVTDEPLCPTDDRSRIARVKDARN